MCIAALLAAACTSGVGPTALPQNGGASPSPSSGVPIGPISSPADSTPPAPSAGSPGPAASPGDIDPCTLLSSNDLATVNGGTYGGGVSHTTSKGRLCVWQNQSPGESVTVELASNTPPGGQPPNPIPSGGWGRYTAVKASLQGFSETDITTVADAAFIARHASAPTSGGIYVQDGEAFFDIVYLSGTVPSDAGLVGVALEVVGKLP